MRQIALALLLIAGAVTAFARVGGGQSYSGGSSSSSSGSSGGSSYSGGGSSYSGSSSGGSYSGSGGADIDGCVVGLVLLVWLMIFAVAFVRSLMSQSREVVIQAGPSPPRGDPLAGLHTFDPNFSRPV